MASKIKVDTIETADGTGNITVNNNVGIGVVPEAWHTDWRSLQIGGNSSIFADAAVVGGGSVHYTQNSFYDGTWKSIATGKSSYIRQTDGKIDFWTAPSVSAGTAITQTVAMSITNDGRGLSQFTAKAWVNFNGTGTVSINDSHNMSSVVDEGVGNYKLNFSNNMANTNYCINAHDHYYGNGWSDSMLVGSYDIKRRDEAGSYADVSVIWSLVFGD